MDNYAYKYVFLCANIQYKLTPDTKLVFPSHSKWSTHRRDSFFITLQLQQDLKFPLL